MSFRREYYFISFFLLSFLLCFNCCFSKSTATLVAQSFRIILKEETPVECLSLTFFVVVFFTLTASGRFSITEIQNNFKSGSPC